MDVKPLRQGSVPAGYKQTEVGVIPEDWDLKLLGAIVDYRNGTAHEGSINDLGKYVVVNSKFISTNGEVRKYSDQRFSPASKGEILMVLSDVPNGRAIARCFFVDRDHLYTVNQRICALRPIQVNGRLLFYKLNRNPFYLAFDDGVKQTNLRKDDVLSCPLPLPPTKAEQEAIAEALSDADALIESLEQLLAKKRHLKQGAMQELLTGKKRLSGFSGRWKPYQLRDCLLTNPDYGINAPGVPSSGDLPVYLRITDIDDDGRFMPNNRVAVNHPQSIAYILKENEIVFARTGASVGKSYLYDPSDGVIVFAGFLIRAKIDCSKLCPAFFASFTKTGHYWNWVRIMSMRSGQPGINGNEYASLDLNLPSLPEQTAIAAILSDMDAEIAALEAKLAKARQLKQGMMQELLTGRIRLV